MDLNLKQELRAYIWQVVAEMFNFTLPTAVMGGTGQGLNDPSGAAQTVVNLYAGNGVPANANGQNGDFYLRGDGSAGTFIYHRAGGTWTAFA